MSIFNSILILFAIYSLAVTSGVISEKSGQLNIAINGMMLFGALFGVFGYVVQNKFGPSDNGTVFADIVSILFAMFGGWIGSLLLSFATLKVRANAGVAGTAINLFAPVFLLVIQQSKSLKEKDWINVSSQFQVNTSKHEHLNVSYLVMVIIAGLAIAGLWVLFKKTKWGFRAEAVGDNHIASDTSGVNVNRTRFIAMSISGMLAGAAGGLVLLNKGGTMGFDVSGIGFIALCMIAMSSWKISMVPIVTLIVAVLFALASYYTISTKKVPQEVFEIIPFILPLIALPFFSKKSKSPRMIGVIYEGGKK